MGNDSSKQTNSIENAIQQTIHRSKSVTTQNTTQQHNPVARGYSVSETQLPLGSYPNPMPAESMANYNARMASARAANSSFVYSQDSSTGSHISTTNAPNPQTPPVHQNFPAQSTFNVASNISSQLSPGIYPVTGSSHEVQHPLSAAKNYDPSDDLGFWVQQPGVPRSSKKVIDLDQNISTLMQNMAVGKSPEFLQLNSQLKKNKALSDIRGCLINNKHLSDITLHVQGRVIHAHKSFLITSSYLLYELFHLKGETELIIDSISYDTVIQILTYCYTNKILVTRENVNELLMAAEKLQIRQITNICQGFVSKEMNSNTIFEIFEKALEENNSALIKKCLDFITKNEDASFASSGFFSMKLLGLTKILEACKFSREKNDGIIEKWHNGPTSSEVPKKPDFPSAPKKTGAKKKPEKKVQEKTPKLQVPKTEQPKVQKLINYDDEDDKASIITHDDENKVRIAVVGKRYLLQTEFSRLDLVCKRSMVIHEIMFSCDLAVKSKEFRLTIVTVDKNKREEVHNRLIKIAKPDQKMNFLRLNRNPLKIFVGQKFFIKINFAENAERFNIDADDISPNHFLGLNKEDGKKYFNCISSLNVAEIPLA